MRVQLLGTGSADGWPSPWCGCASCAWARVTPGAWRGQTSTLVDEVLLVDLGGARRPPAPLERVRTVLLTHAHPDHTDPQLLLWRQWSSALGPLEIAGPPAALALCRPWVRPDDDVAWVELRAGDEVTLASGHPVRALPARHADADVGPALLYDISPADISPAAISPADIGPDPGAPDGDLLVAWDTAPPLPDTGAARFAVVLLECTHGDTPGDGDHHDLADFAHSVAELRRRGAVTTATTVVAVHLSHRNPPGAELHRRLGLLGAVALPDGAVVAGRPVRVPARRVLITGGARSGKSAEAERRLAAEPEVTYVATAPGYEGDEAWAARLALHRARRPTHWRTIETRDLAPLLADPAAVLLIDCVTLWLTAQLAEPDLTERVDALVEAWRTTPAQVVMVTNEVGSGVHPPTALGRRFADLLGRLNARLAAEADEVWLVVAGTPTRLR